MMLSHGYAIRLSSLASAVAAGLVVSCLVFAGGCRDSIVEEKPQSVVATGTVNLLVNFRDEEDLMAVVPCSQNATVLSILERAQMIGDLKFESRGAGETAFVTSINGVENEGASGDNWVYRVNDKLGDQSCGTYEVKPKDQILWSFGKYEPGK